MKKYVVTALLGVALGASSCENEMEFNGEIRDPKLNINAFVVPAAEGGPHIIQVRESVSAWGDRAPQPVTGATFKIRHNGVEIPVGPTTHEDGTEFPYTFSAAVASGDRLELEGSSPLHGTVSASTVVPRPADILDMKVEEFRGGGDGKTRYSRIFVTIADPAGERNYYAVRVFEITHWLEKHTEWEPVTGIPYDVIKRFEIEEEKYFSAADEILFDNIDGSPTSIPSFSQFSDELIDGREYTLNLYSNIVSYGRGFDYEFEENSSGSVVLGVSMRVEIVTLSPELFRYERSAELAVNQQDNSLSEPVQIYSNVAGGYGVFGAYNVASRTAELEPLKTDE